MEHWIKVISKLYVLLICPLVLGGDVYFVSLWVKLGIILVSLRALVLLLCSSVLG